MSKKQIILEPRKEMTVEVAYGLNLFWNRERIGLTLSQMAKKLHVTQKTLERIEAGNSEYCHRLGLPLQFRIAEILNRTPEDLIREARSMMGR